MCNSSTILCTHAVCIGAGWFETCGAVRKEFRVRYVVRAQLLATIVYTYVTHAALFSLHVQS
jgi:hypothetical protein